ncbi:hypothetical protein [Sutcliffiella sp. NC1]|uniref:hypothetical protein n=1 Tax=Sutcliffiella sp. NC1 TaxID=3004096 RepID=UPI0022DE7C0E|nr:hypothetical protein [Sutcliffiella sp. NC1]WBL15041.1 hypothetical protein O1A01_24775 [Sutcliffiella sp. NC1]
MKRLSILSIAVLLLISFVNIVSAETSYEVKNDENLGPTTENSGVSTEPPLTQEEKEGEFSTF